MNEERDKYLWEKMGKCWHEWFGEYQSWTCAKCRKNFLCEEKDLNFHNPNFSTWTMFGMVWEWARKQEWWIQFVHEDLYDYDSPKGNCCCGQKDFDFNLIHPERFGNALYQFLKSKEGK